jgi:hypothetical protein
MEMLVFLTIGFLLSGQLALAALFGVWTLLALMFGGGSDE